MARPPQGQMHPGRQLAVLGLVFVVLYLLVFFAAGASGSVTNRLKPKLGLDLVGGTQAIYQAQPQANGQLPTAQNMEEARKIIENRVNALGVSEAEVVIEGNRNIVVSVAGEARDTLKNVGQAAQMRFRMVLRATTDVSATALNPASAAPSTNPSAPTASAPAKSGATPAPSGGAGGGSGGQGGMAPTPTPTPSAPKASASAPAATPAPSASVDPNVVVQRSAVEQKVGATAWAAASKLAAPVDLSTDPTAGKLYAPFAKLSGNEVQALAPEMQFDVPTISCDQLNARPNGAIDDPKAQVVTCESNGKMFLDVAKVVGTDVNNASPQLDQQQGQWVVSLDFKSEGQKKWTALTREAFTPPSGAPCLTAAQAVSSTATHCLVAVVLDKEVISAPEIQGVLTGQSQITGQFTSASARDLANQIKYGALPVTFQSADTESVSATLGLAQLKAGLLAAGIGMLLVAIYAFFYYRLLGTVIFLSLILSGLLTFGALVVLGRATGFTLTLAGISGFIVSLGVAADSFVIYFERLKDEIHEGRSPRSAVPRAWARARRTIISANTITIMAAVVLYIVSVGTVKGFAFALGLSTILDLVVVFLFRHPIMTMFANTKAFLSPRVSGLGRVLRRPSSEEPVNPRTSRVKEAYMAKTGLADRLYRGEANLNIIGRRKTWFLVAGLLVLIAIGSFVFQRFELGIEFKGGSEFSMPIGIGTQSDAQDAVNRAVQSAGLADSQVGAAQKVGSGGAATYSVRTGSLTQEQADQVKANLVTDLQQKDSALKASDITDNRVSAAWGSQVTRQALIGLAIFLVVVMAYLIVRFEWRMAVAAVSSLLLDLVLTAGVYSLVGFEVTPSTVIGFLTILGFSLYDVVVVFDKVQENTRGITAGSVRTYDEAANLAVNQTVMRSINTGLVALLPVGGLLFIGAGLLGAGTLKDLGLVLFVGMGLSVISSIMFATPLLTVLKDQEPRIKSHNARVLARRTAAKSGDVAPRKSAAKKTAAAAAPADADEVPVLTGSAPQTGSAPRPGSRPTGKRNTNRSGRPGGGSGNRPSGGAKRR